MRKLFGTLIGAALTLGLANSALAGTTTTTTTTTSTTLPTTECNDGIDNDGDGYIDFDIVTFNSPGDQFNLPAGTGDPVCMTPTWHTENSQCQNGHDDVDADLLRDYDAGFSRGVIDPDPPGPDPQCVGRPWHNRECGLGVELAVLLPLLMRLHGRGRRRSLS